MIDEPHTEGMHSNKTLKLHRLGPRWSDLPSSADELELKRIADLENSHGIIMRVDAKRDNTAFQVEIQNNNMKTSSVSSLRTTRASILT